MSESDQTPADDKPDPAELEKLEHDVEDAERQIASHDPRNQRHFVDSGNNPDEDDQTIAPPG